MLAATAAATLLTPACQPRTAAGGGGRSGSDPERNVQTVRDFIRKVFNAHDATAGPTYLQPGFHVVQSFPPPRDGREAYLAAIAKVSLTFPDIHATIEDAFGAGDRVVLRLTIEGTQRGPLWGVAATNRRLRWTGNNIYRLENGKIAEEWAAEDWLAVFRQLGRFEPPSTG